MSILKSIHLLTVAISFSLFFLRGLWHFNNSPVLKQRWIRIAPHLNDTVLLLSAITLAWQWGYTPFNSPWLAAKICALLVYILLGMTAFRWGRSPRQRALAWLTALGVFLYIVLVALTHDPLPNPASLL